MENEAKFRTFSKAVAGEFSNCQFAMVVAHHGLEIPFKWDFKQKECARCGFVNTFTEVYDIVRLEFYVPLTDKPPMNFQVWIGYTIDGRIVFIPDERKEEITKAIIEQKEKASEGEIQN